MSAEKGIVPRPPREQRSKEKKFIRPSVVGKEKRENKTNGRRNLSSDLDFESSDSLHDSEPISSNSNHSAKNVQNKPNSKKHLEELLFLANSDNDKLTQYNTQLQKVI
jgi:hypothetical protein